MRAVLDAVRGVADNTADAVAGVRVRRDGAAGDARLPDA